MNAIRFSLDINERACDEKCKMAAATKRDSNIFVASLRIERRRVDDISCSGFRDTVSRICVGGAGAAFSVEVFYYDSS